MALFRARKKAGTPSLRFYVRPPFHSSHLYPTEPRVLSGGCWKKGAFAPCPLSCGLLFPLNLLLFQERLLL